MTDKLRNKRILADVEIAAKSKDFEYYYSSATPKSGDALYLKFIGAGVYADQTHVLEIAYAKDHPAVPPKLKFITPIFHPNISDEYGVCVDTMKEKWSPASSVDSIFSTIISLLVNPNPLSPLNNDAARSYDRHNDEYARLAYSYYFERILNDDVQEWLKKFS